MSTRDVQGMPPSGREQHPGAFSRTLLALGLLWLLLGALVGVTVGLFPDTPAGELSFTSGAGITFLVLVGLLAMVATVPAMFPGVELFTIIYPAMVAAGTLALLGVATVGASLGTVSRSLLRPSAPDLAAPGMASYGATLVEVYPFHVVLVGSMIALGVLLALVRSRPGPLRRPALLLFFLTPVALMFLGAVVDRTLVEVPVSPTTASLTEADSLPLWLFLGVALGGYALAASAAGEAYTQWRRYRRRQEYFRSSHPAPPA